MNKIEALKKTVDDLINGTTFYSWTHPNHCNCGVVARTLLHGLNPLDRFNDQNRRLEDITDQLVRIGHRLNDTNVPQESNKVGINEPMPFGEGKMMEFYYQLNTYQSQISKLEVLLGKLDAAI